MAEGVIQVKPDGSGQVKGQSGRGWWVDERGELAGLY